MPVVLIDDHLEELRRDLNGFRTLGAGKVTSDNFTASPRLEGGSGLPVLHLGRRLFGAEAVK